MQRFNDKEGRNSKTYIQHQCCAVAFFDALGFVCAKVLGNIRRNRIADGHKNQRPQYNVWQDTYSNTPAVVSYGLTSDLEGYERSYIGRIDLQPDTEGEANMRLFFINRAPDASAAGFDPTQIEFIPGYSYATLGQDLDDPIFPYVLMEGDLNLSYDSGSQKWTLHYEGFFVAPLGHKIKVIADYVGPMDGFTAL